MLLINSAFQDAHGRGQRKSLHCVCGHVVDFHDARGCGGLTMRGGPCSCNTSDSAALDAGVRSFEGSHARFLRWIRRSETIIIVKRIDKSRTAR